MAVAISIDIEDDAITAGGTTKTVDLHEAYIPTYVRAGAFIPLAIPMQSTKDYDENFIQLQYYHHDSVVESEREFYFDDGASVNPIEKGIYQILEFEAEQEGRWLEIDFEADTGANFAAGTKTIQLVVHNLPKEPTQIKLDKQKIQGTYNEKYKTLSLTIDWNTNKEMELRIKRKK